MAGLPSYRAHYDDSPSPFDYNVLPPIRSRSVPWSGSDLRLRPQTPLKWESTAVPRNLGHGPSGIRGWPPGWPPLLYAMTWRATVAH